MLLGDLPERGVRRNPGIREHDIEFALFPLDLRELPIKIAEFRHVSLYSGDIFPDFLYRRRQLCIATPAYVDVRAFVHKLLRRRETDAAIATGNQCNFSFKSHVRLLAFNVDYCYNPFRGIGCQPLCKGYIDFGLLLGDSMGHSKAEKAKTHRRIVAIASKRFREEGLAGVGIADLMKEAGLTVGGFYKHFDSRDDLVAEAVGSALGGWKRQVDAAASGGPPVTYESLVDNYLSEAHRDQPGTGCPVVALAGDIARSDKRTRALVTQQIRDNIELLATLIRGTNEEDKGTARSQAILTYCALVGAIGVARAVSDQQLSREILKTVAQLLKNPLREATSATSER